MRSPQQRSSAWAACGGCGAAASSGGVCADLSAEFHFNETAASREGWERALSPSANRSLPWALSILRWGWAALPSQRTAPVMRGAELPQIGCTQGCWKHFMVQAATGRACPAGAATTHGVAAGIQGGVTRQPLDCCGQASKTPQGLCTGCYCRSPPQSKQEDPRAAPFARRR